MDKSSDKERATCLVCKEVFSIHSSVTTMLRHLQRMHPKEIKEARQQEEEEQARGMNNEYFEKISFEDFSLFFKKNNCIENYFPF